MNKVMLQNYFLTQVTETIFTICGPKEDMDFERSPRREVIVGDILYYIYPLGCIKMKQLPKDLQYDRTFYGIPEIISDPLHIKVITSFLNNNVNKKI